MYALVGAYKQLYADSLQRLRTQRYRELHEHDDQLNLPLYDESEDLFWPEARAVTSFPILQLPSATYHRMPLSRSLKAVDFLITFSGQLIIHAHRFIHWYGWFLLLRNSSLK